MDWVDGMRLSPLRQILDSGSTAARLLLVAFSDGASGGLRIRALRTHPEAHIAL